MPQTSYRTDLVPQLPDRPPIVKYDGWFEFLAVHDRWYLAEKRRFRARLRALHPDLTGASGEFRAILAKYQTWLRSERVHYALRRLRPPNESVGDGIEPLRLVHTVTGKWRRPNALECGTVYRYWQGCRCQDCRRAGVTYRAPSHRLRRSTKTFECGTMSRYWQGCRCPLCQAARIAWERKFRVNHKGQHPKPHSELPEHGTVNRYWRRCRCAACTQAKRDYERARYVPKRARKDKGATTT